MENKVVAVVNGREITEDQLNFALAKFPQDRRSYFETPEGRKQFLDQIISWELIYDYAVENGFENREDFKFQLSEAKKAILTQLAIEDEIKKVHITEEELLEYYNENKDYFNEGETVTARHILVDTAEKASEVKALIDNGLTFEEAAQLYSSCPSKTQGGNLGSFGRGMMVPEFEEAAFTLDLGVLSEPVQTQFGYHLVIVDERTEPAAKSFEEVKESIRQHMLQEKQGHAYMHLVEDLKKKYNVEVK